MKGWLLLLPLLAYVGAHLSIAAGLVMAGRAGDAALAFFVPPLAPWWGWGAGMRRRVLTWGIALAVHAVGVAVA